MKGVVLAGGRGSRLYPITTVINKHLLPIYDRPMIYYPIQTLRDAGCTDILIVTGGQNPGAFLELLKNGEKEFNLNSIMYVYQTSAVGGIADALRLAKPFVGNEKFMMILGDNLILDNFSGYFRDFIDGPPSMAKIFTKEVDNPSSFGVAEIGENGTVTNIIEKPKEPVSNLAVIGVYMYDHNVFGIIENIKPSQRGELEITDVNMAYVRAGKMTSEKITGKWLDTGSFDSLYQANTHIFNLSQGRVLDQ